VRRSRIISALSPIRRAGDYSRVDFVSCLSTDAKEHAMKGHVSWVNELAVKDGALEPFRELMEQMVAGSRAEPGTLVYEWYISPDGGTVQIFETYADSAAVVAHHVGDGFMVHNWAGRFLDCVDSSRCVVLGGPNAAAREILDRLGATYHSAWGGFSRFYFGVLPEHRCDFSATSPSTERRDDTAAFLGSEGSTTRRQEL
jgi:quinol monooxygenase YgiN